jgi:hypothetical protein
MIVFPEKCYTRSPSIPVKKGDFGFDAPLFIGEAALKDLEGWGIECKKFAIY